MAKRLSYLAALLLALGWTASANAQSTQFTLELGAQWVNVSGNDGVYRTQVNEKQGVVLHSFSLTNFDTSSGSKLMDRLRIDASDLGATTQGSFRLEAGLAHAYTLRLAYHHMELYDALPDFANPLLGSGVTVSEQTLNRATDSVDLNMEFLPGHMFTPLFGYRFTRYSGPGTTTVHVGEDEFHLGSDYSESTHEVQAGVGFHIGTFAGSLLQGWRKFDATDSSYLLPGAGDGNNSAPVLGRGITLSSYSATQTSSATFPMTNAYVSGMVADGVRVVGSYVRADMSSDTSGFESASGSLASFKLARFFSGLSEAVVARSQSLNWRGEARVEVEPIDGLQLVAGYTKNHRDEDGFATIGDLYANTVNFSGANPGNISTLLAETTAMQRDEDVVQLKASTRNLGPVQLWAGWGNAKQDLTVTPAAAEIVVPGGQGGHFTRDVKLYSAGADLKVSSLKFSLDWKKDDADHAIVRIDYLNQERWRGRLAWTVGSVLRLVGTGEHIKAENPTAGIDRAVTTKHWGADAEITPIKPLLLHLGYGIYKVDSTTIIRQPQDFSLTDSLYTEDGTSKEASASYSFGPGSVEAGYSRFENTGSLGLTLDRTYARVDVDFNKTWGALAQFEKRKYEDNLLPIANYDATWYGVFLRYRF
jgi:hypothetical protein